MTIDSIILEQECLSRLAKKSTPQSIPKINFSGNPGPKPIINSIDEVFDHLINSHFDNSPCNIGLQCTIRNSDCTSSADDRLHMASSYPFSISAFTNVKGGYSTSFCVLCMNHLREQFKYENLSFT